MPRKHDCKTDFNIRQFTVKKAQKYLEKGTVPFFERD